MALALDAGVLDHAAARKICNRGNLTDSLLGVESPLLFFLQLFRVDSEVGSFGGGTRTQTGLCFLPHSY